MPKAARFQYRGLRVSLQLPGGTWPGPSVRWLIVRPGKEGALLLTDLAPDESQAAGRARAAIDHMLDGETK